MAIRKIREVGETCLTKKCRPVTEINDKIRILADDMLDTMREAMGVGLAAPQVGILKRIVVIEIPGDENGPYVMINPEIIEIAGSQTGYEGCLSLPGKSGIVTRPESVKVAFQDLEGEEYILEGEGLLARAICHECDHLDGIMYSSKAEGPLVDNSELEDEDSEENIEEEA